MNPDPTYDELPTSARLVRATVLAVLSAMVLLVVAVLPAEYGLDPTGMGKRLGLLQLSQAAPPAAVPPAAAPVTSNASAAVGDAAVGSDAHASIRARAIEVFGPQAGQSFAPDAVAFVAGASPSRTDTLTLNVPAGRGVEAKASLGAGQSFVFDWKATGELAVDMHGERPDAHDAYTSYAIDGARRDASGRFTAPFDGQHGWYFENRGDRDVTVELRVTGSQTSLAQPRPAS